MTLLIDYKIQYEMMKLSVRKKIVFKQLLFVKRIYQLSSLGIINHIFK